MSDNWVVQHLINTLDTWNDKLAEVWKLLTISPASFKGGGIWKVILTVNGAMQAIGLALVVLFFLVGMMKTSSSLDEVKRPEHALKLFLRFAISKGVVTYGLELMMAIFQIIQGVTSKIMTSSGITKTGKTTLPKEMIKAIEDCGFFESIPLWAITLIEPVHNSAFFHHYSYGIRQVLQDLYVHGYSTDTTFHFRRAADAERGYQFP